MDDNKLKYLEIIQNIINRLAGNSFALKGWAVTLVSGIFALSSRDADKIFFLIAYIPILVFWGLDSYYLSKERLFRTLYGKVCKLNNSEIDFSLNTELDEFKTDKNKYTNCLFSVTELCFYIPLALLSTIIIIIANCIEK